MPKLIAPLKAPKDPEEYLAMAAWALKNRDRFDATTVMNLAEQAIGAYLADNAQRKSVTDGERAWSRCVQCGQKTTSPIMIKIQIGCTGSWTIQPYCPDCAKDLQPKDPEGGVRQG
jgi:hypothetical protein